MILLITSLHLMSTINSGNDTSVDLMLCSRTVIPRGGYWSDSDSDRDIRYQTRTDCLQKLGYYSKTDCRATNNEEICNLNKYLVSLMERSQILYDSQLYSFETMEDARDFIFYESSDRGTANFSGADVDLLLMAVNENVYSTEHIATIKSFEKKIQEFPNKDMTVNEKEEFWVSHVQDYKESLTKLYLDLLYSGSTRHPRNYDNRPYSNTVVGKSINNNTKGANNGGILKSQNRPHGIVKATEKEKKSTFFENDVLPRIMLQRLLQNQTKDSPLKYSFTPHIFQYWESNEEFAFEMQIAKNGDLADFINKTLPVDWTGILSSRYPSSLIISDEMHGIRQESKMTPLLKFLYQVVYFPLLFDKITNLRFYMLDTAFLGHRDNKFENYGVNLSKLKDCDEESIRRKMRHVIEKEEDYTIIAEVHREILEKCIDITLLDVDNAFLLELYGRNKAYSIEDEIVVNWRTCGGFDDSYAKFNTKDDIRYVANDLGGSGNLCSTQVLEERKYVTPSGIREMTQFKKEKENLQLNGNQTQIKESQGENMTKSVTRL